MDRFPWRSWREGLKSKRKGRFEHKIAGNLITRFEYRHDESNKLPLFMGTLPVSGQDAVLALGLIYTFDDLKELK